MSDMAGALPDNHNPGASQTPLQQSQPYPGGMGVGSQYGSHQFQGQSPMSPGNFSIHPSQYAVSYQEAAAAAQSYGQMQAAQRNYPGGLGPPRSSYPNAPYLQLNCGQQYMYYPGQHDQAGHASFGHSFGQYATESGGKRFHSGYPTTGGSVGQYLRPEISRKLAFPTLETRR